jgi:hypothetical protein
VTIHRLLQKRTISGFSMGSSWILDEARGCCYSGITILSILERVTDDQ